MRPGQAEIHGDLAGRVVEHGARVVVMGPVVDIVAVLADVEDLVFGLHRAVLGQTDVHAGGGPVVAGKIDTRVLQGLVGAVDTDAAGAGTAAVLPLLAVARLGKGAHPGRVHAHVAQVEGGDAARAGQQVAAELRQAGSPGGHQAHPGDDDAPVIHGPAALFSGHDCAALSRAVPAPAGPPGPRPRRACRAWCRRPGPCPAGRRPCRRRWSPPG